MEILFRHERPRRYQRELMEDVWRAVVEGKHVVAHAPTGIGKTDAVISPALTYALDAGKVVVYLSPKISQHVMALKVVSGISSKYGVKVWAVEFVGKRYMCIHPIARRLSGEEFYELCRKLREKESCPYYKKFIEDERASFWPQFPSGIVHHEDIISLGESEEMCPYEIASELISSANVVVGDYYHVFSPRVGKVFLKKLRRKMEDIILIVDEAHNLPERIRKILTFSLSTRTLLGAAREAIGLDPDVARELSDAADEILSRVSTFAPGEERRISPEDLHDWLPFDFKEMAERLEDLGREYIELSGKNRSYLLSVARFLANWDEGEGVFLHYVRLWRDGTTASVVKRALDPSYISGPIFERIHAGILVSGTLTPPEMYRDLLGMDPARTILREYPSPFPKENRLVLVVPTATTRFSRRRAEEYRRIARILGEIIEAIPGNVAVFFPSYNVMHGVLQFAPGYIGRKIFVQREDMGPDELAEMLENFRRQREKGAVLFAVAGGSLAEGIDYPGRDLLGVVVVGIPLAEMNMETQALIEYYEEKLGRGWFYGYIYPAISKALQAAGRCIRSETDRGVIVFLDERYTWKNYRKAFPRDMEFIVTQDPATHIRAFWSENRGNDVHPQER